MTPRSEHQQPKEYPIDYLECARIDIRGNSFICGDSMVVDMVEVDAVINKLKDERVRSRPRPAPSTVVEDITFEGAAIVQAARKEAARKAREESQQRIEQAIIQLEGALTYNKCSSSLSVEHSIKNAIALLQAGRK